MGFFDFLRDLDKRYPNQYSISDMMADDLRGKPRPPGYEPRPLPLPEAHHRLPELIRDHSYVTLPPHHVFFGGRYIPVSELRHMFIAGTTGSGKSLQLITILSSLAREVEHGTDNHLMIVGSKDDAYRMLTGMGIPHIVLNMEDAASPGWDIAADYDDPLLIEELAKILIPAEKSSDPFWQNAARSLVSGVILSFNLHHGTNWGFHDVFNALMGSFEDIITILRQHPNNRAIVELLEQEEIDRAKFGILLQVNSTLRRLLPFAVHCQKTKYLLSIRRDFLGVESVWLIQPSADRMEAIAPVVQAMFRALTQKLSSLPDSPYRHVFVALDEAQFLGAIPGVDKFVEFTRSKGGRLLLCTQTIEGLCEHYGELGARNLLGLFPYKSILRLESKASAQWAVECFGSVEVWEKSINRTRTSYSVTESHAYSVQVRSRILDSDVLQLPYAHPKTGIEGFYIIPKAPDDDPAPHVTAYRYRTPASVVERLKPPLVKELPPVKAKRKGDFVLKGWTNKEWMKFVMPKEGDRELLYRASVRAHRLVLEELFNLGLL